MTHSELIAALKVAAIVSTTVAGVPIRVRPMTGTEFKAFSEAGKAFAKGEGEPITDDELLLRHLVDDMGEPIAQSLAEFDEWPRPLVTLAAKKVLRLSGFSVDDEDPAKN